MEFEGQYLTYQEYLALGGTLDEMPFNLLEFNARMKIDERTFGRLVDKGQEYKEVKLCVYNMITTLNSYSSYNTQNKAISSETTDGYSISYGTPQKSTTEAKNSELEDIIDTYLSNLIVDDVPVLYRGADVS
uniref:Head Tail Connector Protein n=1 Tax=Siphoviridae sp. ctt8434 TaxID=2825703 RepID=A0A8S5U1I5_9CAUD|nr:MAG TPA: Head Tail Connector Protein [Siphoviridae sp. ctt8434]